MYSQINEQMNTEMKEVQEKLEAAEAEVERMRQDYLHADWKAGEHLATIDMLKAQVDELEGALEIIIDYSNDHENAIDIARQAIREPTNDTTTGTK